MRASKVMSCAGVVLAAILWQAGVAQSQVITEGLLSYWTFDAADISGRTAKDAWGDRDGTIIGDVRAAPGKIGEAMEFSPGGRIEFDVSDLPQGDAPRTMAAWVKPEGGGTRTVVEWGNNRARQRCGILILGSQVVYFVGQNADVRSNGTVANGEWHHVAVAYDGTTMRIYIDGAMDTEQAVSIDTVLNIGRIGTNVRDGELYEGCIDEVCIYDRALSDAEVAQNFAAENGLVLEVARVPEPKNDETDVPRDGVVVAWQPGDFAVSHDVYFGTSLEDVEAATTTDPEFKGNQTETTYALDRLEFGQTYYWRIDEVNNVNPNSPWKGDIWSFTVEPIGYPLASGQIVATASSVNSDEEGPENVIDGSGLDANDLHSVEVADMWLTSMADASPWIQFVFDKPYMLHEMVVWNHNSALESDVGFGIKEAMVEYSLDGVEWTLLDTGGLTSPDANTVEFAQATGQSRYGANTVIPFDGTVAQYVRILPISNWGEILPQFGLSEVRFLYVPVWAREPEPVNDTTDVGPEVVLSWRAGRQAAVHDVYLSNDEAAVADGTAFVGQVSEPSYQTDPFDLGKTYYWRVDEVNEAEDPSVWQGEIWDFTITDVLVVEDFESYRNESPHRLFQTWIDGWGFSGDPFFPEDNPGNGTGSTVGHDIWSTESEHYDQTIAETTIVHGGNQSMPLYYDNTGGVTNSMTTRTFAEAQNWTQSGVRGLILYFHGSAGNTGGQLYVKINDTKVSYDGDAGDLMRGAWNKWYVKLLELDGAALDQVTSLSIGIDGEGHGILYIDDIVLTAETRQLITPVEPSTAGLVAHWKMDEDAGATTLADSAGGDNNATIESGTTGVPGKFGNAIQVGGVANPITASDTGLPAGASPCTISAWFQQTSEFINRNGVLVSYGTTGSESGVPGQYRALAKNNASAYRVFHWNADMTPGVASSPAEPDVWHHLAFTFDKDAGMQAVYLDGVLIGTDTIPDTVDVVLNGKLIIGDMDVYTQIFNGLLDEVRIYDRVLSAEEIAWLGGRTMPFDR